MQPNQTSPDNQPQITPNIEFSAPAEIPAVPNLRRPPRRRTLWLIAALPILFAVCSVSAYALLAHQSNRSGTSVGAQKIKHVVIIMQENRSFDSYFGTYPGVDGIPMQNGTPSVCVPDPANHTCVKPYHDTSDKNSGGPHGQTNATADIDGGKMDGFIEQAEKASSNCAPNAPACKSGGQTDVMGYHTAAEIPNYWAYAKNYVLQDKMFEPNASWSLPEHLFMVSEWSAKCSKAGDPQSCVNALQSPGNPPDFANGKQKDLIAKCQNGANASACQKSLESAGITADMAAQLQSLIEQNCASSDTISQCEDAIQNTTLPAKLKQQLTTAANRLAPPDYAWTDMTYLLHKHNVSWGYYVFNGTEPDCQNDSAETCPAVPQNAKTPGIWNPLPYFDTVKQDGQLGNVQSLTNFYSAAKNGSLPAVSWIDPAGAVSEHPPALVSSGQAYVTGLINAVMNGPDWDSTAVFVSWDDWGGFYDHVTPPSVDVNGYGLRVPGLVISPYAKQGYLDHQVLSHDAYNKFIEDIFLGGQRLDPKTDGRPDPRTGVREAAAKLGNLMNDFDFSQSPRHPAILSGGATY